METASRCVAAALVVVALSATGCGSGAEGDEPSEKVTVTIRESGYTPQRVRIPVGSRVTFVNLSPEGNTAQSPNVPEFLYDQRVLDRQNKFDTHTLQSGEAQSVEFDTPGRYLYFSSLNTDIAGLVVVTEDG